MPKGFAEKLGLNVTIVEVATNQAGPVALLSGEADVIVSDWTVGDAPAGDGRAREVRAVLVGARRDHGGARISPIKSLADLKGKKLGVAGGAIDKSWLLLRAYSRKELGTDIAQLGAARLTAPRRC